MTRTALSVGTAAGLLVAAGALATLRWYVLGADLGAPRGDSVWQVTLAATGETTAADAALTLPRPPDFRHQHLFDERFQSKELQLPRAGRGKDRGPPDLVWRGPGKPQSFRLRYAFRCVLGMRRPTPDMAQATRQLDARPADGQCVRPSARVESDHPEVAEKARLLLDGGAVYGLDAARALFEYVRDLGNEPVFGARSALECLRSDSGDSAAKSRLLTALCRSRGVPARLLWGLVLTGDQEQGLHTWCEAWVNDHWVPMCPTYDHFGPRAFPKNYLVLSLGDEDFVRGHGAQPRQVVSVVRQIQDFAAREDGAEPSALERAFRRTSLYALRPAEQQLAKFLLLLPLAALIVSAARILVGVPTFGTFGPALLGLAFLDLKALPWGLLIFLAIVLVGWGLRRLLDKYHLLMVPRVATLLTLLLIVLLLAIVAAGVLGISTTQYIALFPLVILTHLVERFWTTEAEDGTAASLKTLLGTILVTVTISLALCWHGVTAWMFRHPETLGAVLAAQLLIGRYTGYRLSELYRFRDLDQFEEPVLYKEAV